MYVEYVSVRFFLRFFLSSEPAAVFLVALPALPPVDSKVGCLLLDAAQSLLSKQDSLAALPPVDAGAFPPVDAGALDAGLGGIIGDWGVEKRRESEGKSEDLLMDGKRRIGVVT